MGKPSLTAHFDRKLSARNILRRYIDLPKLLDLLRTRELHLVQASRLIDRLEGTLPERIRKDLGGSPEFAGRYSDPTIWESKNKSRSYLSCWTLGAKDNMALWKLYGSATASVAITTTVARLQAAAPGWGTFGRVDVKKVRYIDHAGRLPNGVYGLDESVFSLKHVAYRYENEVRIIVTRTAPKRGLGPPAIRVPVNLERLLRSIVVAPEAGDWFFDLVVDIARRYNVVAPVRRSSLTWLLAKAGTENEKVLHARREKKSRIKASRN